MLYRIYEYDRDYHTVVDSKLKEFNSDKEADRYCDENEGGGYHYFYLKKETREQSKRTTNKAKRHN